MFQPLIEYRDRIEDEWTEVENFVRGEALAEMPETYEEFVDDLKHGTIPSEA
jgi:hypothetical protein